MMDATKKYVNKGASHKSTAGTNSRAIVTPHSIPMSQSNRSSKTAHDFILQQHKPGKTLLPVKKMQALASQGGGKETALTSTRSSKRVRSRQPSASMQYTNRPYSYMQQSIGGDKMLPPTR